MHKIISVLLALASYGQSSSILVPAIGDDGNLVWLNESTVAITPVDVKTGEVNYYLYTEKSPDTPVVIADGNADALEDTTFNPDHDVLFAVHGWLGAYNTSIGQSITANVFSGNRSLNVFIVDWHELSQRNYLTARNSVSGVGELIANFILTIQNQYSVPDNRILLVGHSLGAHIVGVVGRTLHGRARSIVGLDPALPLFTEDGNDTLTSTDAQYVQVIHTNGGVLGYSDAIGDSDFYPNGGTTQAGCLIHPVFLCDHMRAVIYYGESLRDDEVFLGTKCTNYAKYLLDLCSSDETAKMGTLYPDTSETGDFYLKTKTTSPYAED